MTEEERAQLQNKLESKRRRLKRKLEGNRHYGMEEGMNRSIGELSGYDNHPADIGTELYERGKDLALNEEDEEQLEEVEMALARMDTGEYGTCVVCDKEIPLERLEAVPETAYCVEHQRDRDISNRRPVEEDLLNPPYGEPFNDRKGKNFYDGEDAWQDVERYGTSNPPDYFREGTDYNDLTIDQNERRGYVDDMEAIALADRDGRPQDPIPEVTRNDAYRRKQEEEDEDPTD
ncbi:TraR/DksA C4-type zinc finger protein [Paludifilum halophilum]|uniref:Zinc finger DksA/TraR C4-type domain-containing protein n=1 Tax=Paludifilum halophilum TaxID=1642702 RepID=A0A235B2V4_9BACL|nr:TraR/DksA C4-type zinc finger protein [Paludifilum halophilum]OYD06638.1 hypothetical protein CHM34_15125 [Paludifilum halophilum]